MSEVLKLHKRLPIKTAEHKSNKMQSKALLTEDYKSFGSLYQEEKQKTNYWLQGGTGEQPTLHPATASCHA